MGRKDLHRRTGFPQTPGTSAGARTTLRLKRRTRLSATPTGSAATEADNDAAKPVGSRTLPARILLSSESLTGATILSALFGIMRTQRGVTPASRYCNEQQTPRTRQTQTTVRNPAPADKHVVQYKSQPASPCAAAAGFPFAITTSLNSSARNPLQKEPKGTLSSRNAATLIHRSELQF